MKKVTLKVTLLFGFVVALFCSLPLKASVGVKFPILNFLLSLQEEQLNQHRNDIDKFIPDDDAEKFILAVITNDLAGVKKFLADPDVNVNSLLDIGIAPLHYIAARKNVDTRILEEFLTDNQVNANIRDINGLTPLHHAVLRGQLDNVSVLLVNNRVNVNARLTIKVNIPEEYLSEGYLLFSSLVFENGMTIPPLFLALGTRNLDMVKLFFAEDRVDKNATGGEFSQSLLQQAVMLDSPPIPIIEAILAEDGFNVNARDGDGDTALTFAVANGLLDVVKVLIADPDVDVNIPSGFWSQTPVQSAILIGNIPMVRELLANNRVDINAIDVEGDTVLDWAIIANAIGVVGISEIIQELIDRGAKSSVREEQMWDKWDNNNRNEIIGELRERGEVG